MALTKKTPVRGRSAAKIAMKKTLKAGGKKAKGNKLKSKAAAGKSSAAEAAASGRAKPGTVAHQNAFRRRNWAKRLVFLGTKAKTSTGLFKRDLMRNARGTVVSKRKSALGRKRYVDNNLDLWVRSMMSTREDQGITGWVLCKKAGVSLERKLYTGTRAKWEDLVANRVTQGLQRRPEIMGKITKLLTDSGGAASSGATPSTSSSSKVKTEGLSIVPGDAVRVQRSAANFEYRGQTGVVERFQLGRVVVNFHGTLKAVKVEDLAKV